MRCPVCEAENGAALECANCGKVLVKEETVLGAIVPVPGLEQTLQDRVEPPIDALAELESTLVAQPGLEVEVSAIPGVERTPLESDPQAPMNWTVGQFALDSGREQDLDPRTPAPQDTGSCPWCGAPATGAVCDNCGRRRSRYSAPPQAAAQAVSDAVVLCPACFARVPSGLRCSECGTPFLAAEL
jgi:hypothetical protein